MLSKKILILVFCSLSSFFSHAFFNFRMDGFGGEKIENAKISLSPSEVVVGEPCDIVIEFEISKKATIEGLQVAGLPEMDNEILEYTAQGFENLADGVSTNAQNTIKRFALPLRFNSAYSNVLNVIVGGNIGKRVERRGFSQSSFSSFNKRLNPLEVVVSPLPEEGRPESFNGSVGKSFTLTGEMNPKEVHPGDLVTITYEVAYDGYLPKGVAPKIEGMGEGFTAYELKEKEGALKGRRAWTQIVVPKTSSLTNSISFSLEYFDISKKAYTKCEHRLSPLKFISDKTATTENTAVIVNDSQEDGTVLISSTNAPPVKIYFAPKETSPVLQVVPSTKSMRILQTFGKWQRVESDGAIGWILIELNRNKTRKTKAEK